MGIENKEFTIFEISMTEKFPIYFHYLTQPFYLSKRNRLKSFIIYLLKNEGLAVKMVNYVFCNDEYLAQLNQQYLNHNTYTDIITFPLSADKKKIISDIYISIDRIRENAKAFDTTFTHELHRVIFHGALHLCGYKDKTKEQQQQMRNKENFYLSKYFVSRETKADSF